MNKIPCVPLITVDPYFSIWSKDEHLNFAETTHWTNPERPITCHITVDGKRSALLGYNHKDRKATQTALKIEALTTTATYRVDGIEVALSFMTPLFPDDIKLLSRPVSYMTVAYKSLDGKEHDVSINIHVREEMVLDHVYESPVVTEEVKIRGLKTYRMGNSVQNPLNQSGDNIRQDWGWFYLSIASADAAIEGYVGSRGRTFLEAHAPVVCGKELVVMFAYDDIASIQYFGRDLKSAWNSDGTTIKDAIKQASRDYRKLKSRAARFSKELRVNAKAAGGEKYAELLSLAYRQVIAAHKVAIDENGDVLFVSKECFSNGCAATVDVSYPSIPLFVIYNTELIKGMMRPIYRFASSDAWKFDFAPHDVGQYPLVNGQVYGLDKATGELKFASQMPVEECGNMIIMEANVALADGNADFAKGHLDTLTKWCEYLIKNGDDPAEQLCTDDFSGHLAHNCNLSVKAIMGIAGMSIIMNMLGKKADADRYMQTARKMADSWVKRATDKDGVTLLAFDAPGTFSLKYNMIWDKLWNTQLFPASLYESEVDAYIARANKYGTPLDSRADFTKSDWLMWAATLTDDGEKFKALTHPLSDFYRDTPNRVPMTDWYDTVSAYQVAFQNRTVQGGLYIKLLQYLGINRK